MEMLFLVVLVVAAAWRVWAGMSQAEDRADKRYPEREEVRAPRAVCMPGRDGLYTGCFANPDEASRSYAVERERTAKIYETERESIRLGWAAQREVEVNERIATLARGERGLTGSYGHGPVGRAALPEPGIVEGEWVDLTVDYEWVERG